MSAKKKTNAEQGQVVPATVTVEVINQPLYEEGAVRYRGDRFELSAARAEGLRHFVKIVQP